MILGKYVVLFFWPLDFTFVCPTEIVQYSDAAKRFREIGAEVIGASIDSHFTHMEYTKKDGCLIEDGDDAGIAFRATYIIDDKGIVRHICISDLPVGRNVEETLRLVQAFQYSDKYGEVCPASWTPGAATMKPSDEAQLAAFWENEHGKGQ